MKLGLILLPLAVFEIYNLFIVDTPGCYNISATTAPRRYSVLPGLTAVPPKYNLPATVAPGRYDTSAVDTHHTQQRVCLNRAREGWYLYHGYVREVHNLRPGYAREVYCLFHDHTPEV